MNKVLLIIFVFIEFGLYSQGNVNVEAGVFHTSTYYKRDANFNGKTYIGISAPSYKIQGSYSFHIDSLIRILAVAGSSLVQSRSAGGQHVLFQSGHAFIGAGINYQKRRIFGRINFLADFKLFQTDLEVENQYFVIQPAFGFNFSKNISMSIESTLYLTPYYKREAVKPYSTRAYWSLIGLNLGYRF